VRANRRLSQRGSVTRRTRLQRQKRPRRCASPLSAPPWLAPLAQPVTGWLAPSPQHPSTRRPRPLPSNSAIRRARQAGSHLNRHTVTMKKHWRFNLHLHAPLQRWRAHASRAPADGQPARLRRWLEAVLIARPSPACRAGAAGAALADTRSPACAKRVDQTAVPRCVSKAQPFEINTMSGGSEKK
jgi:hypothetical protein